MAEMSKPGLRQLAELLHHTFMLIHTQGIQLTLLSQSPMATFLFSMIQIVCGSTSMAALGFHCECIQREPCSVCRRNLNPSNTNKVFKPKKKQTNSRFSYSDQIWKYHNTSYYVRRPWILRTERACRIVHSRKIYEKDDYSQHLGMKDSRKHEVLQGLNNILFTIFPSHSAKFCKSLQGTKKIKNTEHKSSQAFCAER